MLIKVFSHGKGKGYGPVEYAVAVNPFGQGVRSVPPKVLKGDPRLIMHQIDAARHKWKYSSGAASFAQEDSPTDEQLNTFIAEFEELAFAGLPISSRSILWVLHEESGRKDLHFIIPREETHTGKSFNAFPPNWEKKFDLLRDKFNYQYGWARPDDPARARAWQPGIMRLKQKDAKRKDKPISQSLGLIISDHVANLALTGKVLTRADVIREITSLGYTIPRVGKDYLTILDPSTGKRERLKGTLYHVDFNGTTWVQHEKEAIKREQNPVKSSDFQKAQMADDALQKAICCTAIYNKKRYKIKESNDDTERNQQQPESRASRTDGFRSGEKIQAEEWHTYSGNRVSAQGAGIPGNIYGERSPGSNVQSADQPRVSVHFGLQLSGLSRAGKKATQCLVQQRRQTPQPLHRLGGGPREGHGMETLGGKFLTGSHARTNSVITVGGEQTGRILERRSTGTERNAQFGIGHTQRVARESGSFGNFAEIHAICQAQASQIVEKLAYAAGLRFVQNIFNSLEVVTVPDLEQLARSANRIQQLLPSAFELTLLKSLSSAFPVVSLPDMELPRLISARIEDTLPIAYELQTLRHIAYSLPVFKVPSLSDMQAATGKIHDKLRVACDKKILTAIQNAEQHHKAHMFFSRAAHWAGGDLQKWKKVQRECNKNVLLRDIFQQKCRTARYAFQKMAWKAGADANEWRNIWQQCQENPLLLREFALLVHSQQRKYTSRPSHSQPVPTDLSQNSKSLEAETNGDIDSFTTGLPLFLQ